MDRQQQTAYKLWGMEIPRRMAGSTFEIDMVYM